MNQWLLLIIVFGVGASITRFLNSDKLFSPIRDRIEEYWVRRRIALLQANSAAALVHNPDYLKPESIEDMEVVLYRRAFLGDEKWRRVAWRLDWYDVYKGFIKCPWCVSFWVFLGVELFAWLVMLGAPYVVWGGAWWFMLPCQALAFRWVYGLIAGKLDD